MTYKNEKGQTLYPVCKWSENQHKLFVAMDIVYVARAEAEEQRNWEEADKLDRQYRELERLMGEFNNNVRGDLVYATWKDGQRMKDYIWTYNYRHH